MTLSSSQSAPHARVAGLVRRILALGLVFGCIGLHAQTDPGVRGGTSGAGQTPQMLPGLSDLQKQNFSDGLMNFTTVRTLKGDATTQEGLGPRFNSNSCGSCHSQPAIGGSSPVPNPQFLVATATKNAPPFFVTPNGPVREARFKRVVQNGGSNRGFGFFRGGGGGTPDGGVHDLFTIAGIAGMGTAPGPDGTTPQTCTLAQPDFLAAQSENNLSLRIPTPVFGLGLVESISDATILANQAANPAAKQAFRIAGHPNRNGNDGTITKFGWKAQNATALLFAGEAYSVEMGVSNEIFSVERANPGETLPATCLFNPMPEDATGAGDNTGSSDIQQFATFMEFLAPPNPVSSFTTAANVVVPPSSISNGMAVFSTIGCALCHTPTLSATASHFVTPIPSAGSAVNLFSDLLVHNMGDALADGISQGLAGPSEFRTAPLWGLGQRIFFLHDGRTMDLVQVIQLHGDSESEARVAVEQFNGQNAGAKQDLLNFLRSL